MADAVLTNALRKSVAALGSARERRSQRLFVAEGTRCVLDVLPHFSCRHLMATAEWVAEHRAELPVEPMVVKMADLERMSQQQTPQPVLAVLAMPDEEPWSYRPDGPMVLALDGVQNPGNLGTIMRVADWFGITDILASRGTVDVYNPKVVQATMGAIARVRVHYTDSLPTLLRATGAPVYGTFLDGDNLYATTDLPLSPAPVIVMGNEGAGISPEVEQAVTRRLLIPSFPPGRPTSESLNVAMATGIILSEFSRRIYG